MTGVQTCALPISQEAYNVVRESIDFIEEDKVMYKELDKCTKILKDRSIIEAVEKKVNINI